MLQIKENKRLYMMLDIKAVSKFLSVPQKTVYRWIATEGLPAYKIGERYRFHRVEVLEWATSNKKPVSPAIFDEVLESPSQQISISCALQTGGIHYNVAGSDLESVITSMVSTIHLPESINRELLAGALIAREHLGTTAIGDGIALPHVRNPIIFHIEKPLLALCFLEHAVDFDALDKKPVDTLFTIVTQTVRSHLHILSRLSYMLHQTELRRAINKTTSAAVILDFFAEYDATMNRQPGTP